MCFQLESERVANQAVRKGEEQPLPTRLARGPGVRRPEQLLRGRQFRHVETAKPVGSFVGPSDP